MTRSVGAFSPTERFSKRAADYVRYRPRYPQAVLDTLVAETGLAAHHAVADIGSGTGFSAEMFLQHGCRVFGIEPNAAMRTAGIEHLAAYPSFTAVEGTAEATTLGAASVNYVVAGQALHWFDVPRARLEFARILRPGGWVALLWNSHDLRSPFMQAYDALVQRYSAEVRQVHHSNVSAAEIASVFEQGVYSYHTYPNAQHFDLDGLLGRTFSSSYMPAPGDADADAVAKELAALFDKHAVAGRVAFDYTTELYLGRGPRQDTEPS